MEGDLNVFFILFAAIFLLGIFLFFITNKMSGRPWGRSPIQKRLGEAVPYKVDESRVCKLYGYSNDEVEIKGCVELIENEFLFKDLNGYAVLRIPYGQIIDCTVRFPGDELGSRPARRLLWGWWRLPVPVLAKRNYLRILYKKDGSEETLSFMFNDKTETFMYLKDICKTMNAKIESPNKPKIVFERSPSPKSKLLYWVILTFLSFWFLTERVGQTTIVNLIAGFLVTAACMWVLIYKVLF